MKFKLSYKLNVYYFYSFTILKFKNLFNQIYIYIYISIDTTEDQWVQYKLFPLSIWKFALEGNLELATEADMEFLGLVGTKQIYSWVVQAKLTISRGTKGRMNHINNYFF